MYRKLISEISHGECLSNVIRSTIGIISSKYAKIQSKKWGNKAAQRNVFAAGNIKFRIK